MQATLKRRCFVEFIGTFILVFGIGFTININNSHYSPDNWVPAIILGILISCYGYISGGHFNPAVTAAFAIGRKISFKELTFYWLSQISASLLAIFCIQESMKVSHNICNNIKYDNPYGIDVIIHPLTLEVMGTFLFITCILNIVKFFPYKFRGASIAFSLLMVGSFFGRYVNLSLNPARTLGPALLSYRINYYEPNYNQTSNKQEDFYKSYPYATDLKDGFLIALMSLIGGSLAGVVHFIAHRDES